MMQNGIPAGWTTRMMRWMSDIFNHDVINHEIKVPLENKLPFQIAKEFSLSVLVLGDRIELRSHSGDNPYGYSAKEARMIGEALIEAASKLEALSQKEVIKQ
jgi:hypothetical protein